MSGTVLIQMIGVPAAVGAVCYVLRRRAGLLAGLLFVAAAAWSCALATLTAIRGAEPFHLAGWSLNLGRGLELAVSFQAERFSALIAAGVSVFGLLVGLYCLGYMHRQAIAARHAAYALWALAAALAAALADNLLLFVVAWEVITVMLYLLVNLRGGRAAGGAAKSFVVVGLSDAAMLLGILLLGFSGASAEFSMTGVHHVPAQGVMLTASFLLILAGALAKAGAFPLHTWLPSIAQDAPTSVMAMLPASIDKLLGIYLLARLSLQFFDIRLAEGLSAMQVVLLAVGAVTILSAVMMATIQHDLKRLLSFHAVSQVGYMVLGIGTGSVWGIAGGLFHMINHAIYKSCLFLGAGSVERRVGTTDLEKLGGLCRWMPATFGAMLIAAMAISGVPPLNGFASKWMVYQGVLSMDSPLVPVLLVAAVFGSALTLASFAKVLHSVFWGPVPVALREERIREASFTMIVPMLVLAAACVVFGLYVRLPLERFVAPMATEVGISPALPMPGGDLVPEGGLWSPGLATSLLIAGLLIGILVAVVIPSMRIRIVRPFYGGETVRSDAPRVPGTTFYETLRQMPIVRTMLQDGERGGYDIYHVGGRYGGGIVELLRAIHTGELPLYVSWCAVGAIVLILFLVPWL